jgi:molybdopterin-guanine dinucleotide biosynthesis protein A
MGGGDKGLLMLDGRPMLAHVIERLRSQVGPLALNANGDPARFAGFGLPVVADTLADHPGPLAGILAGMRWAATLAPAVSHIVTAPGDAPLLPRDLVARLRVAAASPNAIALAQSGGMQHPVVGLWPIALADDLESALRDGLRQVRRWTQAHGAVPVAFDAVPVGEARLDPFYNANTPEELDALRRIFAEASP